MSSDWDWDGEDHRPRYRLCQAGFGLMAFGVGLLCLDLALLLAALLLRQPKLFAMRQEPWWDWSVGAPITWTTVVGSYLLWGRWKHLGWQRRAGLLVMLNSFDLLHWTLEHGDALGLRLGPGEHEWLLGNLSMAFGWIEFWLMASLAADVLEHLGRGHALQAGRTASTFSAVGLGFWGLRFLLMTDWARGWPLLPRARFPIPELLLLSWLLTLITCLQVCALCLLAGRECALMVAELNRWRRERDPLKSRSEDHDDFAA